MHDVLDDMRVALELRGFSRSTIETYTRYARKFLNRLDMPLDDVDRGRVERYLLELARKGIAAQTRNVHLASLRFLFAKSLGRPELTAGIPNARVRTPLPTVLSGSEVEQVLGHLRSATHRAMVAALYGAGLRVSEMCRLRIADVDSKRMLLRVVDGKNGDRYVRLSPAVLKALRVHYHARRPAGPYLFPGRPAHKPVTRAAIAKVLGKVGRELGFRKRVHPHALRHSYAVHLLDLGADLRTVQVLLGHRRVTSTTQYLHLSHDRLARAPSPLDALGTDQARKLG
jgi:site-specific recombinase XerD